MRRTDELAGGSADALAALDVAAHRAEVNALLRQASELARAAVGGRRLERRGADLIGADLRDTALAGADLTGALFVTQSQMDAARGDASTGLPASLHRPAHW